MSFLVHFKRIRRGVPEVIATLPIAAADSAAVLVLAQSPAGKRRWPIRTDALRVMDDGGRTLLDWTVPLTTALPITYSPGAIPNRPAGKERCLAPPMTAEQPEESPSTPASGQQRFAAGQAASYAEDDQPETWSGGYQTIRLDDPRGEPQYAIRSAEAA